MILNDWNGDFTRVNGCKLDLNDNPVGRREGDGVVVDREKERS